ncbi:MAG: hypothetical protein ACP5E5_01225 [Acidobacteriaceae bacterium]
MAILSSSANSPLQQPAEKPNKQAPLLAVLPSMATKQTRNGRSISSPDNVRRQMELLQSGASGHAFWMLSIVSKSATVARRTLHGMPGEGSLCASRFMLAPNG